MLIRRTGEQAAFVRILVIKDEIKTAKFLKKGFGKAGFVVDVAAEGLDGLHIAKEIDFDLVILDVMIPSLDGWQVLTRLRLSGMAPEGFIDFLAHDADLFHRAGRGDLTECRRASDDEKQDRFAAGEPLVDYSGR